MPYAKRTRKRRKRKAAYSVRRKRNLPVGGFPDKWMARLRYVETITLDAGAGTYAVNAFRSNGLYDPNQTGTGHQPSNFDRLSAIYDRYTVLGSKCTVYPVQIAGSNTAVPAVLILHVSEDGTSVATAHASGGIDNILEQPRLRNSISYVTAINGAKEVVLRKTFSTKKFFGLRDVGAMRPYSADVTGLPDEGAFFEVAAVSPDDTVNPSSITVRVVIDYIALFTEPKIADAS